MVTKQKLSYLLIVVCMAVMTFGCQKQNTRLLVHKEYIHQGWSFVQADKSEKMPAEVPGVVHTDLLNNGIIGDPFYRSNEKELQWINEKDWIYETYFHINVNQRTADQLNLVFEGLDTHAKVYVNDQEVLRADNMFRTWRVNIKDLVKEGENHLKVYFRSPESYNKEQAEKLAYSLPEDERVHSRKAPYHFGWDWGPKFLTAGIWRPVYIESYSTAKINNVFLVQQELNEKKAVVKAEVNLNATKKGKATIKVSSLDNSFKSVELSVELQEGVQSKNLEFEIDNPKLWWSYGLGDAHLYPVSIELMTVNGTDKIEERIGLRTVELVQQDDEFGRSFFFRLNGVPVFAKGANYIPSESFLTRVDDAIYERTIKDAVKANFNMLRVWGGGIYENKKFYDLCDENGIMVWQDFMFACAMYPGDEAFMTTVREEAVQNVERLRNHPSIVLWCGNNEIYNGWQDWGWQKSRGYSSQDSAKIYNDYDRLFHKLLPEVLAEKDPTRAYWPSSPSYGWGHKESTTTGDNHYWGVWWGKEPFEMYKKKVSRFMSEFGFQSFPDMNTINSFSKPEDHDLASDVMRTHQKHPIGNQTIEEYMLRDYRQPKDFESFVYVSQVLQAEGMMTGIAAHRQAMPYSMGTLYWQFNDCWPVVSWASVDYYGRWKAMHYYVRKAYDNLFLSTDQVNDQLNIYLVSDLLKDTSGELKLTLIDFTGKVLNEASIDVTTKGNISTKIYNEKISHILKGADRKSVVLKIELMYGDKVLADNLHYFTKPKHLKLAKPTINTKVEKAAKGYIVTLKSNQLAKNIYLNTNDVKGWWSNNYFDLLPNRDVVVYFETTDTGSDLATQLSIQSLVDSYR